MSAAKNKKYWNIKWYNFLYTCSQMHLDPSDYFHVYDTALLQTIIKTNVIKKNNYF